jgi:uncharacterized LabA/DUF88 family protein
LLLCQKRYWSNAVSYHNQTLTLAAGSQQSVRFGFEKGVDMQIAIDALTRRNAYDVVLIFSQDQDLKGLATAIHELAKEENRWIKLASAFPVIALT